MGERTHYMAFLPGESAGGEEGYWDITRLHRLGTYLVASHLRVSAPEKLTTEYTTFLYSSACRMRGPTASRACRCCVWDVYSMPGTAQNSFLKFNFIAFIGAILVNNII